MKEKFCFLCQESKNEVGHTTESCPNVTCRTCGLKGHSVKYCPDLNLENYEDSKKSCQSKEISKDSNRIQKELHPKSDKKPKKLYPTLVQLCQKATEKTKKSNSVGKIKKNSTFDNPFLNIFSKFPGREDEMDINANRIKSAKNEEESAETLLLPTQAKNPNWKQSHTTFLTKNFSQKLFL